MEKRGKVLRLVPIVCFQVSGDEILAFYAPEGLWHSAVVGGVFPAKLNEKGDPECYYYAVTYPAYGTQESLYAEYVRAKEKTSFAFTEDGAQGWLCKKNGIFGTEKKYWFQLSGSTKPFCAQFCR